MSSRAWLDISGEGNVCLPKLWLNSQISINIVRPRLDPNNCPRMVQALQFGLWFQQFPPSDSPWDWLGWLSVQWWYPIKHEEPVDHMFHVSRVTSYLAKDFFPVWCRYTRILEPCKKKKFIIFYETIIDSLLDRHCLFCTVIITKVMIFYVVLKI